MQQTPAVTVQEDDNGEIDLLGLFGTLIDHKWLIAAVTGAFMVTGAAYAVLATPVYQANALLQVEAKRTTCWASRTSAGCWARSRRRPPRSS